MSKLNLTFRGKTYSIDKSLVANAFSDLEATLDTLSNFEPEPSLAYTLKDDGTYEVSGIGTYTNTKVEIPAEVYGIAVTSIGDSAFLECSELTSIHIPDGVTNIGDAAFSKCSSLKTINIPDNVTKVGTSAFESCTQLTKITLPDTVTYIGPAAFKGCTALVSINIPQGVTAIQNNTFAYCKLKSINLHSGITLIGNYAFQGCADEYVDIPNSVKSIGLKAFASSAVKSVHIPNSVTNLGEAVFSDCTQLEKVYIYGGLKKLSSMLFNGCRKLRRVVLPEGLTTISGAGVFSNCTSLDTIYIPSTVTTVVSGAFKDYKGSIICGADSQPSTWKSGWNPNNCSVAWGASSDRDSLLEGGLYQVDQGYVDTSTPSMTWDTLVSKAGITITKGAITGIKNTSVVSGYYLALPHDGRVINIDARAFEGCQITGVYVPDDIDYVGNKAFGNCPRLVRTTITEFTDIDYYAYDGTPLMTRTGNTSDGTIKVLFRGTEDKWTELAAVKQSWHSRVNTAKVDCIGLD